MVGTTIITPPFQAKKKPLKKFVASRKRTWNFKSGRTIQCYAFFTHKKFTIQCYAYYYYTHKKFTFVSKCESAKLRMILEGFHTDRMVRYKPRSKKIIH